MEVARHVLSCLKLSILFDIYLYTNRFRDSSCSFGSFGTGPTYTDATF